MKRSTPRASSARACSRKIERSASSAPVSARVVGERARSDRAGDENVLSRDLPGAARDLDRRAVDRLDPVLEAERAELLPVGAERVGLDDVRARLDVGQVRGENGVGIRKARLLHGSREAPSCASRYDPHGAVDHEDAGRRGVGENGCSSVSRDHRRVRDPNASDRRAVRGGRRPRPRFGRIPSRDRGLDRRPRRAPAGPSCRSRTRRRRTSRSAARACRHRRTRGWRSRARRRSARILAPVGPRLGRQHGELVAADAGEGLLLAEEVGDERDDLLQHEVAAQMPVRVVDLLEVVDVEEHERERPPVALAPGRPRAPPPPRTCACWRSASGRRLTTISWIASW